jgi:D-3-phosphoglycerate dehydrogenase
MAFRIFISDKMSPEGLAYFTGHEGFEMIYDPEITMEALAEKIGEYDALVIRSRTKVTRAMLANPGKLKIIGRAGAGVDNVDCEAATEKGIIVMNTPGGNTLSTAEHAISMMLSLARRIPFADRTMREGKWVKTGIVGTELDGKTLGILGLGKIGREVAKRMLAFNMNVLAYDPFLTKEQATKLGVEIADVDRICAEADFITVHTPLNADTRGLIGAERLAAMKPTTLLVNCARGGIVDEEALFAALTEKKIAGAALDVYAAEPLPADHKFRTLDNLVMTPHLAASTTEAQEKVARDIAVQIREALSGIIVRNAVNAPSVDAKTYQQMKPILDLAERMGRFCSQLTQPPVTGIEITYSGAYGEYPSASLTTAVMKGFLETNMSEPVNHVNAMYLAKQLGIRVNEVRTSESGSMYTSLIVVKTTSEAGSTGEVSGTINPAGEPRLVLINNKRVEVWPDGHMIVLENRDVPGIVGSVGVTLGNNQINIANMSWGRIKAGGDALMVINIDQPVSNEVLAQMQKIPNVLWARHIVV